MHKHVPSTGMDHQHAFTRRGILIRRLKKYTYPETASTIKQHPPSTAMHHQQACTINKHVPSTSMDHQQAFARTGILIKRLKKSTYPETASTINQRPPLAGMHHQRACTINRHVPSTGMYHQQTWTINRVLPAQAY